jgi:hypothetical protein
MKLSFYLRPLISRLCAGCFIAALATALCAQGQQPRPILELNACGDLQVFDDGAVVESRDGKRTERRLSEKRIRSLRRVIANAPCAEWRRRPATSVNSGSDTRITFNPKPVQPDCGREWLGFGGGLIEVKITLREGERRTGPFPVYIVCERARQSTRDHAKRVYQGVLKRNWQRFLTDVVSTTDSKSILKDCKCLLP